jgi:hypothetical protein
MVAFARARSQVRFQGHNEHGDTPASYLRKNLRQSGLDYERVTRSFFAKDRLPCKLLRKIPLGMAEWGPQVP